MLKKNDSNILRVLSKERISNPMKSDACHVTEARFVHYFLQCVDDNIKPIVMNMWVTRANRVLPTLARVITKPQVIRGWEGVPSSVVIDSVDRRLHGMIVFNNKPLRPMRRDIICRSRDSRMSYLLETEGAAISTLAKKLGYHVELNEPIMDTFAQLILYHQVKVGAAFWSNIDMFTSLMRDKVKN